MLEGVKVLEYAMYHAAPGAGLILADWGADVTKVEPPAGDPVRSFFGSIGVEFANNPVFEFDNRGKRSITVDAGTDQGREIMRRLAAKADVFLTNVRPGGLERSGLDYESLAKLNPRLVYASVTGYGLTGPDKDRAGFDIASFWARSGMAALTTPKGQEPFPIRTAQGDHVTSIATAAGILAALYAREKTGKGRLVEASLLRAAAFTLGTDLAIAFGIGKVATTRPRKEAVQPLANFFKTKEGRWLCLVPKQTGDEWGAIRRALNLQHLEGDERFMKPKARRENGPALVEALDAAFAALDFAEATARMDAEGLVWAPVQTAREVVEDPQLFACGGVVEIPQKDGTKLKSPGSPLRFSDFDQSPKGPAPAQGEHTEAVLAEAGYSAAEITAFLEAGAVKAAS